jgi:hypothetical protein
VIVTDEEAGAFFRPRHSPRPVQARLTRAWGDTIAPGFPGARHETG